MMTSFINFYLWPPMLILASIIYGMVGHICRLSVAIIFFGCALLVLVGFLLMFISSSPPLILYGLSFDSLSLLGYKFLFPLVLAIIYMVFIKDSEDDKKIASLLLLLISTLGGLVSLASHNWMTLFVGMQCMSIPIYGMMAFDQEEKRALSTSIKYLILSAVAMAFMLLGIVFLYAARGTMDFSALYENTMAQGTSSNLVLFAIALIWAGIGFKMSLAPFHIWTPDIYQGAPSFITTYLLLVIKGVVIFFLLRNLSFIAGNETNAMSFMLAILAILSMWLGNIMMLVETKFIRLVGFFSIGHLGYLVMPLIGGLPLGVTAIFIDFASFAIAILVLMAGLLCLDKIIFLHDLRGLYYRYPSIALGITIALISLAGLPLTVGFVGKYSILMASLNTKFWWLSINMIASSLCTTIAFAKIILLMWQKDDIALAPTKTKLHHFYLAAACALIIFGLSPSPLISFIQSHTGAM